MSANIAYLILNQHAFHTVSSSNQLNTCLEMSGIHYFALTLKVSQLTFKVIVQKRIQQRWENISPFKSYLSGYSKFLIWIWQGAAGSRAASVRDSSLAVAPISHFLSSLQIRPRTYSYNPKTVRLRCSVGFLLTATQHAGSQTRERYYSWSSLHIIVPGDVYVLMQSFWLHAWLCYSLRQQNAQFNLEVLLKFTLY